MHSGSEATLTTLHKISLNVQRTFPGKIHHAAAVTLDSWGFPETLTRTREREATGRQQQTMSPVPFSLTKRAHFGKTAFGQGFCEGLGKK
jgi:hypothetical protein